MNNLNRFSFSVQPYGEVTKFNETISKGRCRIFYKGKNRNGTYITDEFANKLIQTLPYTPVKGIFDTLENDFKDHGKANSQGKIYGIVPETTNFAWEKHKDEDGIIRDYACSDVYYYTKLYNEASMIPDKAESMELYPPSIKGSWQKYDGQDYFTFTDGCFFGLQVLGDKVEPCFEGAAFYELDNVFTKLNKIFEAAENEFEGGQLMKINFKLSDSQKYDKLWQTLNPQFNEEGNWAVDEVICNVYDEYAVTMNCETGTYKRVYYTKNDETDTIEITKTEPCFIIDVNEHEKNALSVLHGLNNNSYELIDENYKKIQEENSAFSTKIEELNGTISTLNTEINTAKDSIATLENDKKLLNDQVASFSTEKDTLNHTIEELEAFKKNVIDSRKQAIISSYEAVLSEEIIKKYTDNMDNYTEEQLDKELTYEQKVTNPDSFSKNPNPAFPKEETLTGIEKILSKYKK